MRNPKFRSILPNYKKSTLEITLLEGRKTKAYSLPFAVLKGGKRIGNTNRFTSLEIDKELGNQAVSYQLQDETRGDFPADFVCYYCDPTYDWSPLNQLKRALKGKIQSANLSIRVLADALHTSPSQVVRLFEENAGSKQMLQLLQLAELAGYHIEFTLRRKPAA
ncbi:MAG: hypothetical protein HYR96_14690 [Deltaproteobacteria bacterium]|nr:hypothetical protein [Deltaproteobacteria bacterium]MBI3294834.1 hypothetical protein [Deltaproteobacteria bacterium]